jgi:hypothetical protein
MLNLEVIRPLYKWSTLVRKKEKEKEKEKEKMKNYFLKLNRL